MPRLGHNGDVYDFMIYQWNPKWYASNYAKKSENRCARALCIIEGVFAPNFNGRLKMHVMSGAHRFTCQIMLVQRLAQVGFYNSLAADI